MISLKRAATWKSHDNCPLSATFHATLRLSLIPCFRRSAFNHTGTASIPLFLFCQKSPCDHPATLHFRVHCPRCNASVTRPARAGGCGQSRVKTRCAGHRGHWAPMQSAKGWKHSGGIAHVSRLFAFSKSEKKFEMFLHIMHAAERVKHSK